MKNEKGRDVILSRRYLVMAWALTAPKIAEAIAIITFKILSQVDDFVLIRFRFI